MMFDDGSTAEVVCGLTGPGHQMHWARWKEVAGADCLTVERIDVDGPVIELVVQGRTMRWFHHDPVRLNNALRSSHAPVMACLNGQALRVDGYWFNCATETTFKPC